ncbi:MAG: hypothetical protein AAFQ98_15030 [Bacteroidota bacterium]
MKKRKVARLIPIVLLCISIAPSCTQLGEEDFPIENEPSSMVDLTRFIDQVQKSVNGQSLETEEVDKLMEEYRNLTIDQFDQFITEFSAMTKCELSDGLAQERGFDCALDYRKAVNTTAINLFGKSYNQLSNNELDRVFDLVDDPKNTAARVASCTPYNFGGNFGYVPVGVGIASIRNVTWVGQSDCDKEISVPGWASSVSHSALPCSAVLIASNRPWRNDSDGTKRILMGDGRYLAGGCWIGFFGWL